MGFVVDTIKEILSSRTGHILLLIHWLFFGVGLYERGIVVGLFEHAYNEPLLIQILMVLDLPGLIIAGILALPLSAFNESGAERYTVWFLGISFQWLVTGRLMDRFIFKKRADRGDDVAQIDFERS